MTLHNCLAEYHLVMTLRKSRIQRLRGWDAVGDCAIEGTEALFERVRETLIVAARETDVIPC